MVGKLSVLIVDDEFLARDELKSILKRRHPDVDVVAEAVNSQQAWSSINLYPTIDGVFLDIHIQNENERAGLDLAYAMNKLEHPPWIVFITGYQQNAVEAHRLHPAHFLLKPLDDDKVAEALEWIRKKHPAIQPKRFKIRHRIINRFGEPEWHTEFIEPAEVIFIAKNNAVNSVKIHLADGRVLDGVNGTIKDWEEKLTGAGFVQIHRSHLVNLKKVKSLKPQSGEYEGYQIALKDSLCELPIGPVYFDALLDKMNSGQF